MRALPYLLIISMINSCIELEFMTPTFIDMMHYFAATDAEIGNTVSVNLLGFCIGAFLYGPLADIYGRRQVMLYGNALLVVGTLGCLLSPNLLLFYMMRGLQGLGAATSAVLVSIIIADRYQQDRAVKLYGLMNAVFTTLMAFSPMMPTIMMSPV